MNFLLVTNERLLKSNKNDTLTKILSRNSSFDYWVALLKNRHHTENFYNKRQYRIVGTRVKRSKSRLALSRSPCLFCCFVYFAKKQQNKQGLRVMATP